MWIWLAVAILTETAATLSLRSTQGFTVLGPSIVVVLGYAAAFFALSQALERGMAIAVAYSIWCGIGISLIAVISAVAFDERPTLAQAAGIALVAVGVVLVQSGARTA